MSHISDKWLDWWRCVQDQARSDSTCESDHDSFATATVHQCDLSFIGKVRFKSNPPKANVPRSNYYRLGFTIEIRLDTVVGETLAVFR